MKENRKVKRHFKRIGKVQISKRQIGTEFGKSGPNFGLQNSVITELKKFIALLQKTLRSLPVIFFSITLFVLLVGVALLLWGFALPAERASN